MDSPLSPAAAEGPPCSAMTPEERFAALRGVAERSASGRRSCCAGCGRRPRGPPSACYDGFEPSARMHIAQGVGKVIHVNKMVRAGCRVKILMADYFALLNKKMGGDLHAIRAAGHSMIRIWKALGMGLDRVEFLWSLEEIWKRAGEYWQLVLADIARRNSFERIIRKRVDICQMGMDQKEVNMLARDYSEAIERKNKPIILSHHMLPGLKEGQQKMSNSDPSSAIFMEDEESVVNQKIKKAFCPPKIIEGNPCLDYIGHIVFPWFGRFDVLRKGANGGDKTYNAIKEVFVDYATGALHPADVKTNLAKAINQILQDLQ